VLASNILVRAFKMMRWSLVNTSPASDTFTLAIFRWSLLFTRHEVSLLPTRFITPHCLSGILCPRLGLRPVYTPSSL